MIGVVLGNWLKSPALSAGSARLSLMRLMCNCSIWVVVGGHYIAIIGVLRSLSAIAIIRSC